MAAHSGTVKVVRTLEKGQAVGATIDLGDGTTGYVRPITPADAEGLVRFHARLSQRAVTLRYFYPHLELRAEEVAHLTMVDGRDRVALVVERAGDLIAVGRYDRLVEPTQAEVAFVVADLFQHHGIATVLLHRLADAARAANITHLIAEVLVENKAMLSVFQGSGFPTESTSEWGTIELKMCIAAAADGSLAD
jgi:RimJ/RimL family protein N-acetyltransferase